MNKLTLSFALLILAGPALAHTGQDGTSGFQHGLQHPIFGLDHLLAMLAVGLWSGYVLPRRFWAGAVTFLTAMAIGAGLSWSGIGFPMVEGVITASILAFGLLTLLSRRGQSETLTIASLAVIAFFATAHGHAHATEAVGDAAGYIAGFLIATAALHLIGIGIARAISRPVFQRTLGAGVALSGLWLMIG